MTERRDGRIWHMVGTTPRAQALGEGLRKAREAAGISLRTIGDGVGRSHTTISRWESGERPPKPVDVATILGILQADHALRAELLDLAESIEGRHWVAADLPDVQRQIRTLLEMERDATRIVEFSQLLVPGLLQTRDYARAIIGAGGVPTEEIETRVAVRLGRRDAITRPNPAHLLVLLDETALHRGIGGPRVMLGQLKSLLEFGAMPNVEIRLLAVNSGWYPGLEARFKLVEFNTRSPVVQAENRRSTQLIHQPADVDLYIQAVEQIQDVAMSAQDSAELIAATVREQEKNV